MTCECGAPTSGELCLSCARFLIGLERLCCRWGVLLGTRPERAPGWALYAMPHHPPLVEGTAEECLQWMLAQPVPYSLRVVTVEAPSCCG